MLSMFCLTASYSRIRFFRLPYSAYSRSFSSDSLEYSSRSLARSGSLSPIPAAFSARADASKRMISHSRPRRYFSLSRAFDCFCKKVLRNEARDYQDALARKRNREVYFSELPVEVLEQFAVRDTYFTDSRTFEVIGHSVCIDDETLAEAISALPVDRRDIILLSYFLDMSDAEIANVLNMVRRSVAYRRTSTLKLLKNLMGGENR